MPGTKLDIARLALTLSAILSIASTAVADESCVRFDVPASVPACDITPMEEGMASGTRLVQIVVPIASRIDCKRNRPAREVQIEARVVSDLCRVEDFAPRTAMFTDIDGSITVEDRHESNTSLGVDANGSVAEAVRLSAKAGTGNIDAHTERYQRIPAQQTLIASGRLERGNGAWFRFNDSPHTTLEGENEIALTLRIPATWRGGMLRIDCDATGTQSNLLGSSSDYVAGKQSFVVAVWLKGDPEAETVVGRYCQIEYRLRMAARRWEASRHASSKDPLSLLFGNDEPELPKGWEDRFMLYDSRSIQAHIRPHLSRPLQQATDQYLASRSNVLQLGR